MKEAYRIDRGALKPPRETPQGFLRVDGYATRVGVLEYPDPSYPGGVRRELRLEEDLFDPGSLASYEGAPITDDHPPEMVSPVNSSQYTKGTVLGAARRDGDHVAVSFQITDGNVINKTRAGKRELSTGYRIMLDETPGVHPLYGRYDVRQRNITVNHLAIVAAGRAGPSARIRMDARALTSCTPAFVAQDCSESTQRNSSRDDKREVATMADTNEKQKIEQLEAQLSATSNALAAEKARADAAETKLSTEKSRADAAEGEVGALKASVTQLRSERRDDSVLASKDAEIKAAVERADKAERALLAVPAQIEAGVKARVDLERAATSVMGPDFRMDGLSDREIMLTVLEKRGHAVDSDRNDSHIRGAFNVAVENWRVGEECLQRVAKESRIERSDSTGNAGALTARQAREQMIARNRGLVK